MIIIATCYPRRGLALAAAALVLLAGCGTTSGSPRGGGPSAPPSTTRPPDNSAFEPSARNHDPAKVIKGIVITPYRPMHAHPDQRVAYDKSPPYGGAHAPTWADCTGTVYPKAVRNENMVHALEHGAVWIAYDPARVRGGALAALAQKVDGQPYMMLSPYPKLDKPLSVQSWGHQLKLARADDPRIDQFVAALRNNPYTTPEAGAPCGTNPSTFDVTNPPPFDPRPPGPDALPVQVP